MSPVHHSIEKVNFCFTIMLLCVCVAHSLPQFLHELACEILGLEVTGLKSSPLLSTFYKPDNIPSLSPFNSHSNPIRKALLLSPLYSQEN